MRKAVCFELKKTPPRADPGVGGGGFVAAVTHNPSAGSYCQIHLEITAKLSCVVSQSIGQTCITAKLSCVVSQSIGQTCKRRFQIIGI